MLQQTTLPAPQAPSTPEAPAPPNADQRQAEIREQVRRAAQDARQAARDAKVAAQQARQGQNGPVIATTSGSPDMPFDPASITPIAEYAVTAFFVTVVAIIVLWPIMRAFARRIESRPTAPPALPPGFTEQLQRIEHTVESMAVEIERISESQRFFAKLQAAKGEPVALPAQPRSGT